MSYNFFILGGDKRMYYLAKAIANDGYSVKVLGFEKIGYDNMLNNNIKIAQSINEIKNDDILLGPTPLTMDNEYVYTPLSNKKIRIDDIKNRSIIAGKIPSNIEGIDILNDESITVLNVIPTAEGAIAKAIQDTNETINKSNVLVLGYGRVGKILCDRLKSFNANIYCSARKKADLAWIQAYGYNPVPLEELDKKICKMKIIFNTIPKMILDKKRLILIKEDAIIIDLASKPGGVDWSTAEKMNIKASSYLGIPGIIAPKTSAEYIKDYIYSINKINKSN